MSESPTPNPTPQPTGRQQPAPPAAIRDKLICVMRGRALMLTMRRADAMLVPEARGHTRAHALAEDALLDSGLGACGALWNLPPPQPLVYAGRPDLAPLDVAQDRLEQLAAKILAHCIKAGFPEPKFIAALVLTLLLRTSAQVHGHLREAGGRKAWVRELRPVLHAARDLANWLEGPSGATTRAALLQELQDVLPDFLWTPAAHHAGRSLGELLPGLVRRFAGGVEAQLAATATKAGRPSQPEPLVFGAEGLLAIWLHFHPLPPSMRDKVDGFLGWAAQLLRLAVEANDAGGGMGTAGSDMLDRTTLMLVLQRVVVEHRRQGRAPHPEPQELRPAWKQGRASDQCVWSDVSETMRQIQGAEPSIRNTISATAAPPR